ncbi:MAG TPA: hypothetical protein VKX41_16015 [Alloacidobacterium sp.]|nr:hypothetical protein [Alloacidobacterium sp.]
MSGLSTVPLPNKAVTVPEHAYNGNIEPQLFFAAVERTEEMVRLQAHAEKRKSLLIFGSEVVGKTRLLRAFLKTQPLALFVPRVDSPREILLTLIAELRRVGKRGVDLPPNPQSISSSGLKGIVQRALDVHPFSLAIDQISGPSRVATGLIKDLNYFDRTPVIFVARTPHMEDIGALRPMCARSSERLEVKEFAPQIAMEFVRWEARKTDLWASNLEEVLKLFAESSKGNPGAIVQMVKMAQFPRYRAGDQIKGHVLYLDYRMGRRD